MMIITIDGPAASGKSTVARALAKKLQYYYLNSGMLYRALGYCLLQENISMEHLAQCDITIRKRGLESISYSYDIDVGTIVITLAGKDVTNLLKTPDIDKAASLVGECKDVRIFFLRLQRSIANDYDLVAEGRDVGSVVFPHADVKFFLTAHPEVRALRWLQDFKKNHNNVTFEDALERIRDRDARDVNREYAPLHVSGDDIIIDNSKLSLQETLDLMIEIINHQKK